MLNMFGIGGKYTGVLQRQRRSGVEKIREYGK